MSSDAAADTQQSLLQRRQSSNLVLLTRKTSSFAPSFSLIGDGVGSGLAFGAPLTAQRLNSRSSKASLGPGYVSLSASGTTRSTGTSVTGNDDDFEDDAEAATAYRFNSMALPALHFAIGLLNNIQGVCWRQFLIHEANHGAGLDPADQALVGSVVSAIPWNLKIFVAFTSDVLPICGYRRKSYLLLGLLVQGGVWTLLGFLGRNATLQIIAAQQFLATFGQMMVGVMCDALVVENVGYERGSMVGRLQTTCNLWLAAGGLLGTVLAGVLPQYAGMSNDTVFVLRGAVALGIAPATLLLLRETARGATTAPAAQPSPAAADGAAGAASDPVASATSSSAPPPSPSCCVRVASTWRDVWRTMTQLRVFKPLIFIFVFAACPSSTDAFNTYLIQQTPLCRWVPNGGGSGDGDCLDAVDPDTPSAIASYCAGVPNATDTAAATCDAQWGGLGFDDVTYTAVGLLGSVGSVLGNWLFRRYLLSVSWYAVFTTTVLGAALASSLQLLLMFRDDVTGQTLSERLHMPDIAFALGDDVVVATANQLLAMPILILMARLCPPGAEGTTYALVTSVQMVGGTVGGIFSQIATARFDVTNLQFSRLWQLTLLTSTAKCVALPFLPLVPRSADVVNVEQRSSYCAGVVTLSLFVGGLGWAVFQIATSLG